MALNETLRKALSDELGITAATEEVPLLEFQNVLRTCPDPHFCQGRGPAPAVFCEGKVVASARKAARLRKRNHGLEVRWDEADWTGVLLEMQDALMPWIDASERAERRFLDLAVVDGVRRPRLVGAADGPAIIDPETDDINFFDELGRRGVFTLHVTCLGDGSAGEVVGGRQRGPPCPFFAMERDYWTPEVRERSTTVWKGAGPGSWRAWSMGCECRAVQREKREVFAVFNVVFDPAGTPRRDAPAAAAPPPPLPGALPPVLWQRIAAAGGPAVVDALAFTSKAFLRDVCTPAVRLASAVGPLTRAHLRVAGAWRAHAENAGGKRRGVAFVLQRPYSAKQSPDCFTGADALLMRALLASGVDRARIGVREGFLACNLVNGEDGVPEFSLLPPEFGGAAALELVGTGEGDPLREVRAEAVELVRAVQEDMMANDGEADDYERRFKLPPRLMRFLGARTSLATIKSLTSMQAVEAGDPVPCMRLQCPDWALASPWVCLAQLRGFLASQDVLANNLGPLDVFQLVKTVVFPVELLTVSFPGGAVMPDDGCADMFARVCLPDEFVFNRDWTDLEIDPSRFAYCGLDDFAEESDRSDTEDDVLFSGPDSVWSPE